ncbi:hypothetical protein ASF28_10095 [Methylobacterium sp. Leaf99]|uniref:DUF3102 domain-containing protein n=1 Tax=Methylobacterium sp. Leaf99 TaxID=1736251 RepID=UPI0006F21F67|nr:DUF3102 domain-containing protein [Methylobacterium sp. Leaf99]KQP07497.1 hypothetical protein ASF28_10095 [Methylobacterium sp. Leaf99]
MNDAQRSCLPSGPRTAADIIEIGRDLIEIKGQLGHGHFLPWIEAEFGMSVDTAHNFMRVADCYSKLGTVPNLPATVLYELTAPSTPELIREEGFHRLAPAREAELETIACEVRTGTIRDAILHSAGANTTHGLRRSNADKRRAVQLLLEDKEWSKWADREIARRCFVGHPLVAGLRALVTGRNSSEAEPRTYQDRHGNVTQMRTSAIGRRPPEMPEPEAPAEPAPPADLPNPAEPPADPTNVVALNSRLSSLPTPEAMGGRFLHLGAFVFHPCCTDLPAPGRNSL